MNVDVVNEIAKTFVLVQTGIDECVGCENSKSFATLNSFGDNLFGADTPR